VVIRTKYIKKIINGKCTYYLCKDKICHPPIQDPETILDINKIIGLGGAFNGNSQKEVHNLHPINSNSNPHSKI